MCKLPASPNFGSILDSYFYFDIIASDRNTIDAAADGALVDKTPMELGDLISIMAKNSQSFGSGSTKT